MAGRGSVSVDKGGTLGIRRAALDREIYCFVHHLGGGRTLFVSGHCLFHPSITLAVSPIVRSTARKHPQDDNHLVLVIEAEAHAPLANPLPPLDRVEFPDVPLPRRSHELVEGIQNPPLDRRIESLQITPGRWRDTQ